MQGALQVIALALMTCSCAQKVWTHASKNQQAFYADKSRCEVAAAQSVPAGSVPPGMDANSAYTRQLVLRNNAFKGCMAGQGWYLVPARSAQRSVQSKSVNSSKSCWDSYEHLKGSGADEWYLTAIREQCESEEAK